jgi:hypothetical protein
MAVNPWQYFPTILGLKGGEHPEVEIAMGCAIAKEERLMF